MKRYIWSREILKSAEGGPGTAVLKRILHNRSRIKLLTYPSHFIGHTSIKVITKGKEDMLRAARILREYGYVKSMKEVLNDSVMC